MEIYEQLISTKLICTDFFSWELGDLVTRLMSSYDENRLEVECSVMEHCCFRETDWSMVMMSPPYVPGDRN